MPERNSLQKANLIGWSQMDHREECLTFFIQGPLLWAHCWQVLFGLFGRNSSTGANQAPLLILNDYLLRSRCFQALNRHLHPPNPLVTEEGSPGSYTTHASEALFQDQGCRSKPQVRGIFISAFQHFNELTWSDTRTGKGEADVSGGFNPARARL